MIIKETLAYCVSNLWRSLSVLLCVSFICMCHEPWSFALLCPSFCSRVVFVFQWATLARLYTCEHLCGGKSDNIFGVLGTCESPQASSEMYEKRVCILDVMFYSFSTLHWQFQR